MHTLHSRDTWLKQARVVRLGEVPYKVTIGAGRGEGAAAAAHWGQRPGHFGLLNAHPGEESRADFSNLRKTKGRKSI